MAIKAELRGIATAALVALAGILLLVVMPMGLPGVELLQTLRFHLAALGLVLAVVLSLLGARWRGVLMLILVVASVGQGIIPLAEGYQRRAAVQGETLTTVRLLSYNVLVSNATAREAADFIISEAPDIAVIMEAPGIEALIPDISAVLPYRLGCEDTRTCDLVIFSRTPLVNPQMILMHPFRFERLAVASTTVRGVPINIVGMHLSKPYFDEAAWFELWRVGEALKTLTGRVIISGDFNAAAWSGDIASFVRTNSLVPPPWHPATWPVDLGPFGVPIDNMFTRGAARIDMIEAPANPHGSNHLALRAEISLLAE